MSFMWDPFVDFPRLDRDPRIARANHRPAQSFAARVDVAETDEALLVRFDVPGVKRDELEISFDDDVLTVSGERKASQLPEGAKALVNERAFGRFARRFAVTQAVDPDLIEAQLADGVLTVRLPKKPSAKPRRIEVKDN